MESSGRKREGLSFDVHKSPADRAHARVKVSRLGTFKIGKETPDPRRNMLAAVPRLHGLEQRDWPSSSARAERRRRRADTDARRADTASVDGQRAGEATPA